MTSTNMTSKLFRTLLLSCLLPLIVACGSSSTSNTLPALDSDAVILAFGDSITYGTGARPDQSYPAQLSNLIGRKVINAGVPGETSGGGLARLPKVFSTASPDLVLLCLGGNDFLKRQDRQLTRKNLHAMISWIQLQDVPVILLAVPELSFGFSGTLKPAGIYRELAADLKLPLIENALTEVLSDRSLKADPIHPNAQGYRQLAEAIADYLTIATGR